jgi:hypothetical protein
LKYFVYIAILIRLITQGWGNDDAYFAGVHIFDTTALIALGYMNKGIDRSFLYFFAGCAFGNLIKPLYTDPTIKDVTDYYFCAFGVIFIVFEYVYKSVIRRYRA